MDHNTRSKRASVIKPAKSKANTLKKNIKAALVKVANVVPKSLRQPSKSKARRAPLADCTNKLEQVAPVAYTESKAAEQTIVVEIEEDHETQVSIEDEFSCDAVIKDTTSEVGSLTFASTAVECDDKQDVATQVEAKGITKIEQMTQIEGTGEPKEVPVTKKQHAEQTTQTDDIEDFAQDRQEQVSKKQYTELRTQAEEVKYDIVKCKSCNGTGVAKPKDKSEGQSKPGKCSGGGRGGGFDLVGALAAKARRIEAGEVPDRIEAPEKESNDKSRRGLKMGAVSGGGLRSDKDRAAAVETIEDLLSELNEVTPTLKKVPKLAWLETEEIEEAGSSILEGTDEEVSEKVVLIRDSFAQELEVFRGIMLDETSNETSDKGVETAAIDFGNARARFASGPATKIKQPSMARRQRPTRVKDVDASINGELENRLAQRHACIPSESSEDVETSKEPDEGIEKTVISFGNARSLFEEICDATERPKRNFTLRRRHDPVDDDGIDEVKETGIENGHAKLRKTRVIRSNEDTFAPTDAEIGIENHLIKLRPVPIQANNTPSAELGDGPWGPRVRRSIPPLIEANRPADGDSKSPSDTIFGQRRCHAIQVHVETAGVNSQYQASDKYTSSMIDLFAPRHIRRVTPPENQNVAPSKDTKIQMELRGLRMQRRIGSREGGSISLASWAVVERIKGEMLERRAASKDS